MKIYVVSKGVPERMHTFAWLERIGLQYEVVVHDKTSAKVVADGFNPAKIHVTGKKGLLSSRLYIMGKLAKKGEWYCGMDDNIRELNAVHERYSNVLVMDPEYATRKRYRHPCNASRTAALLLELIRECEKRDTVYGGFASQENPFFRLKKWGYYRFVKSKLFVMKNVHDIKWQRDVGQDSHMSAQVVAKYGCVVVNNYVHAVCKMYETGGLGKAEERRPKLNESLALTIKEFPGLVDMGKGANTALRFLRHSDTSVQRWRKDHGWIK